MRALLTDEGTAAAESALCNGCYEEGGSQGYAREMAGQSGDVDWMGPFMNADFNEVIECCICGKQPGEEVSK